VRTTTILLAALILGSVVAGYAVASAEQTPTSTTSTKTLAAYQGTTLETYAATVRPNTLEPNGTVLGPGGGALFSTLLTNINLSFSFFLNATPTATVHLAGGFQVIASGGGVWNDTLVTTVPRSATEIGPGSYEVAASTEVNVPTVLALFTAVQNETNFVPANESVSFVPIVFGTVGAGGQVAEVEPAVAIRFAIGDAHWAPALIAPALSGTLTATTTTNASAAEYLDATIGLLAALLVATAVVAAVEYRASVKSRSEIDYARQLRQFTTPYQDAIADTATPPRNENVVSMYDWEDLVHVADMLGKPILQFRYHRPDDTRHFFYVLDGSVQYVYLVPREGRSEEGKNPYDGPPK
jgi:hypothetical protein